MSNSLNIMYPEGKKISIGQEEFTIKPFVLANRTKVLRLVAEALMEYSKANPEMKPGNIELGAKLITTIIDVMGDKLIGIYEIVLGKPTDWLLEKVTMVDEIDLIKTISEVNDLPFLFEQVKGLIKTLKNQKTS